MSKQSPITQRFWAKVDKCAANGCWIWNGSKDPHGYGHFKVRNGDTEISMKEQRAHRIAWLLTNGPIPHGVNVLHNCPIKHVTSCVNPAHLKLGNQSENLRDAYRMGTRVYRNGTLCHSARLTDDQVREIRRLYEIGQQAKKIADKYTYKELAKQFGMKIPGIACVVTRRSWSHIP